MNSSYYLRAQNFAAPSVNENDLKYNSFRYNNDSMNNENVCCTNNIMFDSRVCRGNTFSNPVLTEEQRRNRKVYERTQLARRSLLERRHMKKFQRPITPPPVNGRVHVMIQTDGTLEDIFGSKHVEIIHSDGTIESGGRRNGETFKHDDITRDNKRLDLVTEKENDIVTDQKLNDIFKDVDIAHDAHLTNNMARTVYEETKSNAKNVFQEEDITNDTHLTNNVARTICQEAELDDITSTHLTNNIARAIYEEAKNDAITRIGHGPTYYSD